MLKITLKKVVLSTLVLSTSLFANYENGVEYYQAGEFEKAFPLIKKEAEKGKNNAAEYRLAEMYEKGQGTPIDKDKAFHWFKEAASKYAFVDNKPVKPEAKGTFTERISAQIGNETLKEGNEYAISKMDINTPETKAILASLIDGNFFGIKPYKRNFVLPLSYSDAKPRLQRTSETS